MDSLPADILFHIFDYLDWRTLKIIAQVNFVLFSCVQGFGVHLRNNIFNHAKLFEVYAPIILPRPYQSIHSLSHLNPPFVWKYIVDGTRHLASITDVRFFRNLPEEVPAAAPVAVSSIAHNGPFVWHYRLIVTLKSIELQSCSADIPHPTLWHVNLTEYFQSTGYTMDVLEKFEFLFKFPLLFGDEYLAAVCQLNCAYKSGCLTLRVLSDLTVKQSIVNEGCVDISLPPPAAPFTTRDISVIDSTDNEIEDNVLYLLRKDWLEVVMETCIITYDSADLLLVRIISPKSWTGNYFISLKSCQGSCGKKSVLLPVAVFYLGQGSAPHIIRIADRIYPLEAQFPSEPSAVNETSLAEDPSGIKEAQLIIHDKYNNCSLHFHLPDEFLDPHPTLFAMQRHLATPIGTIAYDSSYCIQVFSLSHGRLSFWLINLDEIRQLPSDLSGLWVLPRKLIVLGTSLFGVGRINDHVQGKIWPLDVFHAKLKIDLVDGIRLQKYYKLCAHIPRSEIYLLRMEVNFSTNHLPPSIPIESGNNYLELHLSAPAGCSSFTSSQTLFL